MPEKPPKIIQLTTPLERFQKFDQKADQVLKLLDDMGELYADLGFRQSDVEDYTKEEMEKLKDELGEHGRLVLFMLHHPLIATLQENRLSAEEKDQKLLFPVPTGVWQHFRGTKYEMLGPAQSTDFKAPAVMYREADNPDSRIYTITLAGFYRKRMKGREKIDRFIKIK